MLNKKADFTIGKLLSWLLGIAVLLMVLFFLFQSDINLYLKNLPGYSYTDVGEDINLIEDFELDKDVCPVRVGGLVLKESKSYVYLDRSKIDDPFGTSQEDLFLTGLIWNHDDEVLRLGKKKIVGFIPKGKVVLSFHILRDPEVILDYEGVPSIQELNLLEGSFLVVNVLCKSSEDVVKVAELAARIKEKLVRDGISNTVGLVFDTWKTLEDGATVHWSFSRSSPVLNIKPNGKDNLVWAQNAIFTLEDLDKISTPDKLGKYVESTTISYFHQILFSKTPNELSINLARISSDSEVGVVRGNKKDWDRVSAKSFSNILYGVDSYGDKESGDKNE